jgi:hypothetical protein
VLVEFLQENLMRIPNITCNRPLLNIVTALLLAGAMSAQTTTTTTTTTPATNTCSPATNAPSTNPVVQALNIERAIPLTAFNTTLTPTIPSSVLPGVQSGANEIRESINYSPQACLLTVNLFTVQAGAPNPTASSAAATTTFSTFVIKVDRVYSSVLPTNSLMFVGLITTNSPASPFGGNLTGAPAAVAVGYTNDTPPTITNVVTLVAGTVVEYSAGASGTLTFVAAPAGPPTTTGSGAVQIVIKSPGAVTINQVSLDASGTTGANAPFTYAWTVTQGTASINNPTAATSNAILLGGLGQYTFQVTVTDSKGNSAQKTVTITYN